MELFNDSDGAVGKKAVAYSEAIENNEERKIAAAPQRAASAAQPFSLHAPIAPAQSGNQEAVDDKSEGGLIMALLIYISTLVLPI